jgi:HAD superfamily hydrolase (TIGR01549 family)
MPIKAIIFDFDGVIKNSTAVKKEAFRALYEEFGQKVTDGVVKHHMENGGVSRYDKIRHYHQVFLGIQLKEKELQEWCDRFSELVLRKVIDSPFVIGAEKAIQELGKDHLLFIISGTPQHEMDYIVRQLALQSDFEMICGSPKKKEKWVKEILDKYRLSNKETIFVGDAMADFEAADACRLHFVLRTHSENERLFEHINCKKIPDLEGLVNAVKQINSKLK